VLQMYLYLLKRHQAGNAGIKQSKLLFKKFKSFAWMCNIAICEISSYDNGFPMFDSSVHDSFWILIAIAIECLIIEGGSKRKGLEAMNLCGIVRNVARLISIYGYTLSVLYDFF
jgi:hypothetical protein